MCRNDNLKFTHLTADEIEVRSSPFREWPASLHLPPCGRCVTTIAECACPRSFAQAQLTALAEREDDVVRERD